MSPDPSTSLQDQNLPLPPALPQHLETPFVIELRRLPEENPAYFRPIAVLRITPTLRQSGLLRALSPELAKTLLFILTFVSPQGQCLPTIHELCGAMGASSMRTRSLVGKLLSFRWQGEPILRELRRETGAHAYTPTPLILSVENSPELPPPAADLAVSQRDAVITHSREQYARPRAAVEAEIEEQRHALPSEVTAALDLSSDRVLQELRRRLLLLGVSDNQVHYLLSEFMPDRIARQILWLKYRKPRNPAALVVSAIEHDYEAPAAVAEENSPPAGTPTGETQDTERAKEGG